MIYSADSIANSRISDFVIAAFDQVFDTCHGTVLGGFSKPVIWTESNGIPTAFLAYSFDEDHAFLWLDLLFVRADHRKLGFATALLDHILDSATQMQAATVAGNVNSDNMVMKHLLEVRGFRFEADEGPFLLASLRM